MCSKKTLNTTITLVIGITAMTTQMSVQAFMLNNGDQLTIESGVVTRDSYGNTNVVSGSFFSMDTSGDSKIQSGEKTALAEGTNRGITVGKISAAGASHTGAVTPEDTGEIDSPWNFASNTGTHFLTTGVTGDTTNGLDFSGWSISWNSTDISMGDGSWQPNNCIELGCDGQLFTNGIAAFTWDGIYGNAYTLSYTASTLTGAKSGTKYYLFLQGVVESAPEVPVPAAFWLFGSGLLCLLGIARRST